MATPFRTCLALLVALGLPSVALSEGDAVDEALEGEAARGILPSLNGLLPPDSPLRLRLPDEYTQEPEDLVYDRRFPFGAQEAVKRGVTLPEPWGVSLSYIDNSQAQNIRDLSVALGKGFPPPPDTPLVDLPFVSIENAESHTQTKQVRADLWVLPFLNVFGGIGKVTGRVPLDVVVDLDQTGLCPPIVTCNTVRASFEAGVDTNTATLGMLAAYGWENWFLTGAVSATASFSGNTDGAVKSVSVSGRFGRRWAFGRGHIISPFVGVSYLDLSQVVTGTTKLDDAFPDGDSLDVRYRARISNPNKVSGVIGFNIGFVQGVSIAAEYNFNETDRRGVISTTYRF